MRILTLVAGAENLDETELLTKEIRDFNAQVDFRLRFLHIEIDESHAASSDAAGDLARRLEHGRIHALPGSAPLEAAARLALLLDRERPDLLLLVGNGEMLAAGRAAADATGTKTAIYGRNRGESAAGELDLGETPRGAVEGMTGVAREIDG